MEIIPISKMRCLCDKIIIFQRLFLEFDFQNGRTVIEEKDARNHYNDSYGGVVPSGASVPAKHTFPRVAAFDHDQDQKYSDVDE